MPTLEGKVSLKIPAETQSGKVFRLRGKGVKGARGGQGDVLCHVQVETPVKLDEKQKQLLVEFNRLINENPDKHHVHSKNWLEGMKNFFRK